MVDDPNRILTFYLPPYYVLALDVARNIVHRTRLRLIDDEVAAWFKLYHYELSLGPAGDMLSPPTDYRSDGDEKISMRLPAPAWLLRRTPQPHDRACVVRHILMERLPLLLGDRSLEEWNDTFTMAQETERRYLEEMRRLIAAGGEPQAVMNSLGADVRFGKSRTVPGT